MNQERRSLFQGTTWRFLWSLGFISALVVTFQYFEQPYGNIFSYLSSSSKTLIPRNDSLGYDPSLPKPKIHGNITMDSHGQAPSPVSYDTSQRSSELNGTNSTIDDLKDHRNDGSSGSVTEDGEAKEQSFSNKTDELRPILEDDMDKGNITLISENERSSTSRFVSPIPALPPKVADMNASALVEGDPLPDPDKEEQQEQLQTNSSASETLEGKKLVPQEKDYGVVSISDMKYLLQQSRTSYRSVKPKWSSAADQELLYARTLIENAASEENDSELFAPLYWNVSMFKRSYELMEKMLKVYVYKDGEKPVFHKPVVKGIYASEGWFMKQLESSKTFVTRNPSKAHLFYLPFSTRMLEVTLYVQDSHSNKNLIQYLKNYLDLITAKYPFWNRTEGADHFLVACHDWAPSETREHMPNCIRSLCHSDVKEGFIFGKDASLPETYIATPKKPLRDLGGKPPSKRPILAFFAGRMHGYLRPILLQHWGGNRDPDMKIFGVMPKSKSKNSYVEHMKSSKYCICAKGFEVNSPRVVEAIFYECVPVIISDNFVPPFFEVLNWESFAVFVLEKDIPNLKNILVSIPERRYREMQNRVKKVQQHFLWHPKPMKYDVFHMILHSVWYNRVFLV